MPDEITKKINEYKTKWNTMDKNQKLRIILSVVVILASAIVAIVFVSNPNYTELITASSSEVGEMSKTLTSAQIDHKITNDKTTIVVPEKQMDAAQIALSQSGLVPDGMKFKDSLDLISFSTTQSDKDKIYKEYYEAKLEEKLEKMDTIRSAVVTFTIPQKSVFLTATEDDAPTASVMITPRKSLSEDQINGIVKMVASSVERLDEKNITILDNEGNILNQEDSFNATGVSTKQLEFQAQKTAEIEKQLTRLLAAVTDNVVVMANIICDFDQEISSSITYETPIPDSDTGLLRSQSVLKENLQNMDYGSVPGTESNQGTGAEITSTGNGGTYSKSDITSNYEYNQESKEKVKGLGNIDPARSSITVSLQYGQEFTEAPDEESIDNITKMVSTATGVNLDRITVASFKVTPKIEEEIKMPIDWAGLLDRYAPYLTAVIIILILVVFILRLKDSNSSLEDYGAINSAEPGATFNATVGLDDEQGVKELDNNSEVKQQINKFIEKQPDIAAGMLRNWIYENEK